MLSTLITSKVRLALVTLFVTHPEERFYQTQLIRELGLSSSLIQAELKKLEAIGFLNSSREANTRYFQDQQGLPDLPRAEEHHLQDSRPGRLPEDSLTEIGEVEVALIYGSVAKNIEDMRSDVDLLVIGDVDMDELHEAVEAAEASIGREINPTVYTRKEWDGRVKLEQAFVTDILSGPKIFLIGDEDELRGTPKK